MYKSTNGVTKRNSYTTASAERSFSSLKRIKTYLRTTMCNERLTDLAILSIHSRRAKKIDLERVVHINMYPNCRLGALCLHRTFSLNRRCQQLNLLDFITIYITIVYTQTL